MNGLAFRNPKHDAMVKKAVTQSTRIGEMVEKKLHLQDSSKFVNEVTDIVSDSIKYTSKQHGFEHLYTSNEKAVLSEKENREMGKVTEKQEHMIRSIIDYTNPEFIQDHNIPQNALTGIINANSDKGLKAMLSDPQGASLGNYTLQIGQMFIIEFGSNLDQSNYFLRKYFPTTPIDAQEFQLDRGAAPYGRVSSAPYGSPLPSRSLMNTYGKKFSTGRYSEELRINPKDMLFNREKGSTNISSGVAGLNQKLSYETLYAMVRLETGLNLDLSDVVLRNGLPYPVGSTNFISTGIPAENTYVFPQTIGTFTKATGAIAPNNSIDIMAILGAMLVGWQSSIAMNRFFEGIAVNPIVYAMIMQNTYFQAWMRQRFITSSSVNAKDEVLRFFTLDMFEKLKFYTDPLSWNPEKTNYSTGKFAKNIYDMCGNQTNWSTVTPQSFFGFLPVDTSSQGGTLGSVLISPDIMAGSYMSGSNGYGVQVFDMTALTPTDPHIKLIPFATYLPVAFMPEAIKLIDFNVVVA